MSTPPTILTTILAKKAEEVARRRHAMPISALEEIASGVEKPRGFYNALFS
jgi:indole-3-glycerol phosphate synthase